MSEWLAAWGGPARNARRAKRQGRHTRQRHGETSAVGAPPPAVDGAAESGDPAAGPFVDEWPSCEKW